MLFQVNSIRIAAVLSVLVLISLLLYLFYLTAYKNSNRTLHFRGIIKLKYIIYYILNIIPNYIV